MNVRTADGSPDSWWLDSPSDFTLPPVFSDRMVVQQGTIVPIWCVGPNHQDGERLVFPCERPMLRAKVP